MLLWMNDNLSWRMSDEFQKLLALVPPVAGLGTTLNVSGWLSKYTCNTLMMQMWAYVVWSRFTWVSLLFRLTHLTWTKWPPYSRQHFKMHFHEWKGLYSIQIQLMFVRKGPVDGKSALVQVMAGRRTGAEPLSELMLTQFTDTYMLH